MCLSLACIVANDLVSDVIYGIKISSIRARNPEQLFLTGRAAYEAHRDAVLDAGTDDSAICSNSFRYDRVVVNANKGTVEFDKCFVNPGKAAIVMRCVNPNCA